MLGKEVCNKRLMPSWIFPTLSHKIEVYTGREPVASQPFSIFEVKCAVKGGGKEPVETCCWEILLTSCAPGFWVELSVVWGFSNHSHLTHSELRALTLHLILEIFMYDGIDFPVCSRFNIQFQAMKSSCLLQFSSYCRGSRKSRMTKAKYFDNCYGRRTHKCTVYHLVPQTETERTGCTKRQ